jgi:hypothetical protein
MKYQFLVRAGLSPARLTRRYSYSEAEGFANANANAPCGRPVIFVFHTSYFSLQLTCPDRRALPALPVTSHVTTNTPL